MKHTLQIHMTNECNLNCPYCYIKQDMQELSFDKLKNQISHAEQLSRMLDDNFSDEYDVTFFGGEPLLKIDNLILYDKYIKDKLNVKFSFVQTNGILLNEQVKEQLDKNNINIGISCDGCSDKNVNFIENIYRSNLVPMHPKMMVDGYNVSQMMKNIRYFVYFAMNTQQNNFYIDVSFVKDNVWDKDALQELKFQLDELLIFYKKVYQDTGMLLGIGFLDRAMQNMIYGKRKFICFAGKNGFSITPSGIIYPCSRFYSVDKYKLYDSNTNTYFEDNINFIKANNVTENNKCVNCKINRFCNQGCYYSQLENESIIDGYCSVLKLIFKFTAGLYKEMKNECDVYITERKGVKF